MRRTYLLLFREFKSNLILKIIYIIYVLLSAAVAIFALLEMIIEAPFEAFFGGIQFVLLLSLLHLVFYSLVSYEFVVPIELWASTNVPVQWKQANRS